MKMGQILKLMERMGSSGKNGTCWDAVGRYRSRPAGGAGELGGPWADKGMTRPASNPNESRLLGNDK